MYAVGLTGGIASGKTTISNLFADLGVPIVDTDIISRELLQPGELAYQQVVAHFGDKLKNPSGDIDRSELRKIIFTQHDEKNWLETMLHPLIYQRCHQAMVKHSRADYVLAVIPLLFETNFQSLVDRILVVDCPAELQIERLVKRDQIDAALAEKMLAQQLSNAERLTRAHDIIENLDGGDNLKSRVTELHQSYLNMSAQKG